MTQKPDNPPAFPHIPAASVEQGMTLRDYFAAHAPEPNQAQIDERHRAERLCNPHNESHKPRLHSSQEIRAILRWEYADAMLKARESSHDD